MEFLLQAPDFALAVVWVLYVRIYDIARGGCYYLETRGEATARAQEAALRLHLAGLDAEVLVANARRDKIAAVILAEAEALGARSIILGTRTRRTILARILGSTSATVARRSHTPVILVSADGQG